VTTRLRSAGWILGTQVAGVLVAFPMSILLARVLGPSGKGTVAVVQLVAGIGSIILAAGLPGAITYLTARGEVSAGPVLRLAWAWAVVVGGSFVVLSLVGGSALAQTLLHVNSAMLLMLSGAALIPMLATAFTGSYLLGVGRLRTISIVNIATVTTQLVAYVVLWRIRLLTPVSAIVTWVLLQSLAAIAASVLSFANPVAGAPIVRSVEIMRRGWRFGLASWLGSGLGQLSLRVDMFLVAALAGTTAVGVYSISVTLAELAWYVPNSVYTTLFPRVSADGQESAEMTARVNRALWPLTLLVSTTVAFVGIWLIPLLWGKAFSGAVLPLWLLVPGITASAAGIVPSAFLAGVGKPQAGAIASALNLVTNVAVNLVLIPAFGVPGAAVASSISYAIGTVVLIVIYVRVTGLSLKATLMPSRSDISGFVSSFHRVIMEKVSGGR
jgi:O-antigen/teichoic acid export membrane protein